MKKAQKIQKLTISRETLRQLDPQEVGEAVGAFLSSNYVSCVGNCQTTKLC
ncbi:MAG TPA: hypothetical protein VGR07_19360 [Thermoanaerobaculia bacterium]|jgi:hypothetical protein|nr:hypothetical protein [Thermoanaerobaculia bacterium]